MCRPPRNGVLVLVCEKCERRLHGKGRDTLAGQIDGALTELAAEGTGTGPVRLERVGCMKVCPEDGVTVCAVHPRRFARPDPIAVHAAEEAEVFFAVEVTETLIPGAGRHETQETQKREVSEAGLEPATVSLEG